MSKQEVNPKLRRKEKRQQDEQEKKRLEWEEDNKDDIESARNHRHRKREIVD